MEPCTAIGIAIAIFGALAGLLTAGSQVASTTSQIRGTAKERDVYRQKSETTEKQLGTIQEESRRKDILIVGLIALLAVVYQHLLEAQGRISDNDAELAKLKSERDSSRKTVKNIQWYGAPAVVIALVLVFFVTKQHYGHPIAPVGHVTTSLTYSASR